MTKQTVNFISAPGSPEVNVEVDFDFDAKRVYADGETVAEMAIGVLRAGLFDTETEMASAADLLQREPGAGGRYDVTDALGGWQGWLDGRIEQGFPDDNHIQAVADEADMAFWSHVAKSFPEVTSSDVSPEFVMQRRRANGAAVLTWLVGNHPDSPENKDPQGTEYVVDVFIPLAVSVRANDPEQAKNIAYDFTKEQGIREKVTEAVEETDFYFGDADYEYEVGENS